MSLSGDRGDPPVTRFVQQSPKQASVAAGKMVDEAKKATEAAQATVNETRRIGEAQTVAYPAIDALQFELGERESDPYRPIIRMEMKNAGNTPAFDLEGSFALTISLGGDIISSREYPANVEQGQIRIDPGMQCALFCTPNDIAFSQYINELRSGDIKIQVVASSTYRVVFGNVITNEDHYRSSAIFCHPSGGEHAEAYTFNIKMAKYSPEKK